MYTVLVIDDSASMRRIITDMINKVDDFEVVDTAVDAFEARDKIKELEPDLVSIDLNMPKMDGAVFLRNLMKLHPMPAIIISSESERGNDIFDDGAVGFVSKPSFGDSMVDFESRIKDTLLNLTFLLRRYTLKKPQPIKPIEKQLTKVNNIARDGIEIKIHPNEVLASKPTHINAIKIVGIGASTGGINSLLTVFKDLPIGLAPIVITQHIPYGFSSSFAQRLNNHSAVTVHEARDGMKLEKGHAYLAPGNMHMSFIRMNNTYTVKLLDTAKVSRHKPSVDIMFRSLNNIFGKSTMAIMMTGMGDDGSIGMKELFDNGAYTVAQDEKSSVVFGMPKKAIENGAVKDICSLSSIASYIVDFNLNLKS
jgi:two-component system chemotaxis response regulator CheB